MTTATSPSRPEPKICAQTLASIASLGILIHVVHELFAGGAGSGIQTAVVVATLVATLAVTAAWYRMARGTRRAAAVVLGLLWAVAASEHVMNVADGGSALDV